MTSVFFKHLSADENFLPTSRPDDTFDNVVSLVATTEMKKKKDLMALIVPFQDNVLAAEKPPDAPSHEESSDVFLKKDDFLFDSFEQWKGPQDPEGSENDVFVFEESTASPATSHFLDRAVDQELVALSESELTFISEQKIKNSSCKFNTKSAGTRQARFDVYSAYFSSSQKSCGYVSAYFQVL